jgi:hypothetical protein
MNYEKLQFERASKTGRNFSINLKEIIDRFIWTIELCHI